MTSYRDTLLPCCSGQDMLNSEILLDLISYNCHHKRTKKKKKPSCDHDGIQGLLKFVPVRRGPPF